MSQLKTDALPSAIKANYAEILDKDVVNAIEDDLTINEKISIIFLCAAEKIDTDFWRNFMQKLMSYNEKVIFDKKEAIFIICDLIENVGNWKDKFIEALCIINNKRILTQLGLIVDDLYREYCPLQARIVGKINVGNKILFKFFESLSEKESENVLKKIYSDICLDRRLSDINLMEIHALYWLSIGFIKITPTDGDLGNLLKYLKPLGYFDTPFYSDIEWYNQKYTGNKSHVYNTNSNLIKKFKSLLNLTKKAEEIDSDKILIKKGLCLIINEKNFQNDIYEVRHGSQADVDNLKKTFQALGFIVKDYENRRAIEIAKIIHQHANAENKQYDCFAVCLLSHGYPDGILSIDGEEISFEDIEKCICQKEVKNTLKLVIVQACQGQTMGLNSPRNKLAVDGVAVNSAKTKPSTSLFTDGYPSKPAKSIDYRKEFLLFKSTMKGYVAIRHKEEGSWFINDVCSVLNEFKTQLSIDEWSRQVKKKISLRHGDVEGHKAAGQLAETERDRRTKEYFFFNQFNSF
ncbi:GSCOCT00005795001.2-RA-CDS [Cotesia congregata]|uniref:Dredd_IMDPathway_Cc n=1 Tax=Cotesia congregata TaxID=51543 RepID=A0A8J2MM11_COTCN|nr:GSCOCT00005795001.2-RA-CDS [Cotesia congregata]CAG5083841.1 Dredd_IMDPathway_Cc [Cotesia congregata]